MNSYLIALIAFACIFGGAMAGFFFQRFLPSHHLTKESLDSVKLGAGLIATMAALILGLLVSSSKGTFDRVNVLVNEAAANVINLDRTLRNLGPEAQPIREVLRLQAQRVLHDVWPEDAKGSLKGSSAFRQEVTLMPLIQRIAELRVSGQGAEQYRSEAIAAASSLNLQRSQITVESTASLPLPLVVIPILWITFLIFVYGVFAPRNATVKTVLFFCALSIAGAIYLICEMSMPLDGSIKVPSQPFRTALELISR